MGRNETRGSASDPAKNIANWRCGASSDSDEGANAVGVMVPREATPTERTWVEPGGLAVPEPAGSSRRWSMRTLLIVADLIGVVAAFGFAEAIFWDGGTIGRSNFAGELLVFAACLPVWFFVAYTHGLYGQDDERANHGTVDEISGVLHLVCVGGWIVFLAVTLSGIGHPYPPKVAAFLFLATSFMILARGVARAISRRLPRAPQRTLIVGAGHVGQLIAKKLLGHPEYGVGVVGFVDRDPLPRNTDVAGIPVLGSPEDLLTIVQQWDVERVIVAFVREKPEMLSTLIAALEPTSVRVDIVPQLYDNLGPSTFVHLVEGLPLLGLPLRQRSQFAARVKRTVDVTLAGGALIIIAPALALIAILIKRDSPGPAFYRHERVGKEGQIFRLFKFRTMFLEASRGAEFGGEEAERRFAELMEDPRNREEFEHSYKLHDDPRVTRFGRFLRRTSLDELPQLINVLSGDMSLVGPRPVTEEELARYGTAAGELLTVRPGVTGYWQINGRSDLAYAERIRLDTAYLRARSIRLDLVIMAKTLRVMLSRSGAF
jgi:exopolysaccharide biosynthesis polyprenyl glycosylphosphotransferase